MRKAEKKLDGFPNEHKTKIWRSMREIGLVSSASSSKIILSSNWLSELPARSDDHA
jgi:hypothetical protein